MLTLRRRILATIFSLMALFCFAVNAKAQPLPTAQQTEAGDSQTVVMVSSTINWDTIRWVEPRYKIEAISFKAIDETGVDWWGSDEVMIKTEDVKGWTVSREIGNIDSGDTHNFDPTKSCIVGVRPGQVVLGETSVCDDVGEPAPLGFYVEFWEKGWSWPPFGFCIPAPPGPGRHGGPYCVDDGNGDDFIGSRQIDYLAQELEAALPTVGDELVESIPLDRCPGQICSTGWGPWGSGTYAFTWRITRLPNVRVDFLEVLNEATQKIGARSDIETLLASLRALQEPSPRKAEPETPDLPVNR